MIHLMSYDTWNLFFMFSSRLKRTSLHFFHLWGSGSCNARQATEVSLWVLVREFWKILSGPSWRDLPLKHMSYFYLSLILLPPTPLTLCRLWVIKERQGKMTFVSDLIIVFWGSDIGSLGLLQAKMCNLTLKKLNTVIRTHWTNTVFTDYHES